MPRGNGSICLVHYRGQKKADGSKGDDFIVYIDDIEDYTKWKEGDKSIAITRFAGQDIYTNHKHGHQTAEDRVSDRDLHNEFGHLAQNGKPNKDEILEFILQSEDAQVVEVPERQGPTNDSMDHMRTK
jgi:hypothetical protein